MSERRLCKVFPRLRLGTLVLFWITLECGNRKCVWHINIVNKKGILVEKKAFDCQVFQRRLGGGGRGRAGSCETCLRQKLWCFPPFFCKNFQSLPNESHFFLRVIVRHQRVGETHKLLLFFQTRIS